MTAAKPDTQDCFNRAVAIAVQRNPDVAARYIAKVLMVSAVAARKADESEEAIELLHKASLLEEKDVLVSWPPDIIKPTHELAGEMLFEMGRQPNRRARVSEARKASEKLGVSWSGQ